MEDFPIQKLGREYWPPGLHQIPNKPNTLYYRGTVPDLDHKLLCIIGPRKYTDYCAQVCENLIKGLKGFPITIVSGLAYGIDSIAHKCALDARLKNITFPGSGLDKSVIYPKAHFNLALQILESGGTLISEFSNKTEAAPWTFPKRNRLMAGISDAVLVIEAGQKSGTMITSRLALDYNRNVLAVPGSIFNLNSVGTNNLIKDGAVPITNSQDILWALGFNEEEINLFQELEQENYLAEAKKNLSAVEKNLLEILTEPLNIDQIALKINLPINIIIQTLIELEMKNLIQENRGLFVSFNQKNLD
jgi:DNA processing protein